MRLRMRRWLCAGRRLHGDTWHVYTHAALSTVCSPRVRNLDNSCKKMTLPSLWRPLRPAICPASPSVQGCCSRTSWPSSRRPGFTQPETRDNWKPLTLMLMPIFPAAMMTRGPAAWVIRFGFSVSAVATCTGMFSDASFGTVSAFA